MPSNPFRVGPSVETARWLPGTFKDAGITHLFNNLISFNERLFFSPWLCTTLFFFLLLCYFHPFPPFGGGYVFSVPKDAKPLGTARFCPGTFISPDPCPIPRPQQESCANSLPWSTVQAPGWRPQGWKGANVIGKGQSIP